MGYKLHLFTIIAVMLIISRAGMLSAQPAMAYNKSGETAVRELPDINSKIISTYSNYELIPSAWDECGFEHEENPLYLKYLEDCKICGDTCDNWLFTGSGYLHADDLFAGEYNVELQNESENRYTYQYKKDETLVRVVMKPINHTKYAINALKSFLQGEPHENIELELKEIEVVCGDKISKDTFPGLVSPSVSAHAGKLNDIYIVVTKGDGCETVEVTWVIINGEIIDYDVYTAC